MTSMRRKTGVRRNFGTMVAASILSAGCGLIQTFWIPRVLSVDDFGRWRMFLLYIGYAGLLHLGLVDGALLRWSQAEVSQAAGRRLLGHVLRFLASEHLTLIAFALLFAWLHSRGEAASIVPALAAYALLFNLVGATQVYLQSQSRFTLVASGMSGPGVLFTCFLGVLALSHATVSRLLVAYLAAWTIVLAALLAKIWRERSAGDDPAQAVGGSNDRAPMAGAWRTGLGYIAGGWPIVLANTGLGFMQSADRVTVNLTRPIHDFAIYSLSQSTIYVPITILAAVSRVVFSLFSRVTAEDREGVYRSSTRMLTMAWMLLLPYYFAVDYVVERFLPKYVPGLPAGRILLLSVLFLSLIQIVQLNTYNLEGRQRQFFAGSLFAVSVAFITAWIGSRVVGTLTAVAWSQVITAMLWWLGNECFLRRRASLLYKDVVRVLAGFAFSLIALEFMQLLGRNFWLASLLYTAVTLPVCMLLFRTESKLIVRKFTIRFGGEA